MTTAEGAGPLRVAQVIETLGVGGAENLAVRIANAVAEALSRPICAIVQPVALSSAANSASIVSARK